MARLEAPLPVVWVTCPSFAVRRERQVRTVLLPTHAEVVQDDPLFLPHLKRRRLVPDGVPIATLNSRLLPVRRCDQAAMLKVTSEEERVGGALMAWWLATVRQRSWPTMMLPCFWSAPRAPLSWPTWQGKGRTTRRAAKMPSRLDAAGRPSDRPPSTSAKREAGNPPTTARTPVPESRAACGGAVDVGGMRSSVVALFLHGRHAGICHPLFPDGGHPIRSCTSTGRYSTGCPARKACRRR